MARDSFFTDFEIVEEKKLGPITIILARDVTINQDDPDWNWGYGIRTDFKTAVQDEQLKFETHVINLPDGEFDDFYQNRGLKLGDYPDDTICSFSMSGDEEEEMRDVFNNACNDLRHYEGAV